MYSRRDFSSSGVRRTISAAFGTGTPWEKISRRPFPFRPPLNRADRVSGRHSVRVEQWSPPCVALFFSAHLRPQRNLRHPNPQTVLGSILRPNPFGVSRAVEALTLTLNDDPETHGFGILAPARRALDKAIATFCRLAAIAPRNRRVRLTAAGSSRFTSRNAAATRESSIRTPRSRAGEDTDAPALA